MKRIIEQAYRLAKEVRERAYAPYSNFKVGAVLVAKDSHTMYSGCNVENASFGATICAERSAILNAISSGEERDYIVLVVVTDSNPPAPPCALCLQVLSEFCDPSLTIALANLEEVTTVLQLRDLLPHPFDGKRLKKLF